MTAINTLPLPVRKNDTGAATAAFSSIAASLSPPLLASRTSVGKAAGDWVRDWVPGAVELDRGGTVVERVGSASSSRL
jgi:hypothetical protein